MDTNLARLARKVKRFREMYPLPIPKRVYKAPQGECAFCDEQKEGGFFPPHDASVTCQSGKHNHCTCDSCF